MNRKCIFKGNYFNDICIKESS